MPKKVSIKAPSSNAALSSESASRSRLPPSRLFADEVPHAVFRGAELGLAQLLHLRLNRFLLCSRAAPHLGLHIIPHPFLGARLAAPSRKNKKNLALASRDTSRSTGLEHPGVTKQPAAAVSGGSERPRLLTWRPLRAAAASDPAVGHASWQLRLNLYPSARAIGHGDGHRP